MNKHWKVIVSSSLIGLFVFFYLLMSQTGSIMLSGKSIDYLLFFLFLTNVIGFSVRWMEGLISQKTTLRTNYLLWFLFAFVIDVLVVGIILLLSAKLFNFVYFGQIDFETFFIRNKTPGLKIIILSLLILLVYIITDYALYSYHKYLDVHVHGEKLAADKLRLHFEALENQLSPHYLFNNLNTVVSLIYTDKEQAEDYVRQLANTYKYILSCKNKKIINIKDELDFIHAYTFLMKTRYKEALFVEIHIDERAKKSAIVPLSLQILLENAIKHNKIQHDKPLIIRIFNKAGYLVVENNLNSHNNSVIVDNQLITNVNYPKSHKIGLQNIQKRYELLSHKKVLISKTDTFRVEIPILEKR